MGFVTQWTGINGYMVRSPGTFFIEYDERHGIGYPIAFMLASYVAIVSPFALIAVVLNVTSPVEAALGAVIFLSIGIAFWLVGLVEALLAHGIVFLFGGRGVPRTLEAYAFPTVVRYALWWVPLVNIVLGFYGLYLQIKGIAAFHDISTGKAAVAALLASVLYLVPVIVILAAVIGAFMLDLGSQPEPQQAAFVLEIVA